MTEQTNPVDFKEATGSQPQAATPANPVAPESNPATPPSEPPKEAAPAPAPAPADANPPQEQDWKKRYDGTAKDLKETAEALERAVTANVKLAEKDPENLSILAENDPQMADKVALKLHGQTYEEYQNSRRIEDLRSTDPDRADLEERLAKLESSTQEASKAERVRFLEEKGIMDNVYDEKFKKLDAKLKVLDKDFVKTNPREAYQMAYDAAFGKTFTEADIEKAKQDTLLAAQAGKEGGGAPTEGGQGKIPMSPQAKAFNALMK